jgi:hypothetical protein
MSWKNAFCEKNLVEFLMKSHGTDVHGKEKVTHLNYPGVLNLKRHQRSRICLESTRPPSIMFLILIVRR